MLTSQVVDLLTLTLAAMVTWSSSQWCDPQPPCGTCALLAMERDSVDCGRYYVCSQGRLWASLQCVDDQIYSLKTSGCVHASTTDECRQRLARPVAGRPDGVVPTSPPHLVAEATFLSQPNATQSTTRGNPDAGQWTDKCGLKMGSHIVGGQGAGSTEWVWQVNLQYYRPDKRAYVHACGGTLIHTSWVLTAAHCVYGIGPRTDRIQYPRIVVGDYRLDEPDPWERRLRPIKVILHPDYQHNGSFPNDLALLQLPRPIKATSGIRPACLPNQGTSPLHRQPEVRTSGCWTTGWGYTLGTNDPLVLNEIKMALVTRGVCSDMWPGYILDTHVCARPEDRRGVGACMGDSGGPLVCTRGGRFYLEGVVSWGEETCQMKGYPNIFTQVSYYTDWIRRQIEGEARKADPS